MTETGTTTPRNPGWIVQLAIHRAVRRDVGRLAAALDADRQTSPQSVQCYWEAMAEQLHEHHVLEDTVVWPLMRERLGPDYTWLLDRNLDEHATMTAAMDGFATALISFPHDRAAARAALAVLDEAIHTHLADEEADVLPLIPVAFTLEDIAYFQTEAAKTSPGEKFLPWLLDDATDDDVAFFTGQLPPPVRALLDEEWIPNRWTVVDALELGELVSVH